MSTGLSEAMNEIQKISDRYYAGELREDSLLDWITEIVISELYKPEHKSFPRVYEAKDAKLVYIPSLAAFNVLVYVNQKGHGKELLIPLTIALEEVLGCVDLEEAKSILKLMKSDCCAIAKQMQKNINDALYVHACTWRIFDC